MNFTKLSLAALAVMGIASSASAAIENVKVDGDVKLWYQTTDSSATRGDGLFKKEGASGDLAATLKVAGELTKNAGFGLTMNALTTLGLENHVVTTENAGRATSTNLNGTDANPMWFSEMYMTYKAGKTLAKLGRQELNTPLCYTETWAAAKNTFEAGVLINQDIPDTTLIAAMVSKSNGAIVNGTLGSAGNSANFEGFFNTTVNHTASYVGTNVVGTPANSIDRGAFAVAMVNKSVPNLTIHPVYYDVTRVGKAYWIDLAYDAKIVKVEGLYTNLEANTQTFGLTSANDKNTGAYALKVSGKVADLVTLGASYSAVEKGTLNVWNFATYNNGTPTTKLYTAGAGGSATGFIPGIVDTTGFKVEASTTLAGFGLGAYYNSFEVGTNGVAAATKYKPNAAALIVDKKVSDIDLHVAYISENDINAAKADQQVVRVVATLKF